MTTKEKKALICKMFELYVQLGYSLETIICKPLSYFDFEKVKVLISDFEKELQLDYDSQV